MVSKTDVLTEALVAAIAAAAVTIVLDQLQVAPRVSKRLRPQSGQAAEAREAVAEKPLLTARLLEAAVAWLLLRLLAGTSRTMVTGVFREVGLAPTRLAAKQARSGRSWAPSIR